jgi:hypothetical protein
MSSKEAQTEGRLRARPVQVTGPAPVGLQPLMLSAARDSYLYLKECFELLSDVHRIYDTRRHAV